jgi:hypothetical protein
VAVGAAGFLQGDAVQDSFDQLPDAVLPQIARHRDQGRRIHQETPFGPWAGRLGKAGKLQKTRARVAP